MGIDKCAADLNKITDLHFDAAAGHIGIVRACRSGRAGSSLEGVGFVDAR